MRATMSQLVQIGQFNFRFECQPECTQCCTMAGNVYLTEHDADRIAAHLEVTPVEFRQQYCVYEDDELRLLGRSKDPCRFVTAAGCSIHEVKPVQCRTFPFWPEYVANKRSWKNLSRFCPGIGVGPIIPVEQVRADALETREAYPDS